MKIMCSCCARQIVPYCNKGEDHITKGPVTYLWSDKYCCSECSEDLDENGLFPEERSLYE
jgi:hypothetical protein